MSNPAEKPEVVQLPAEAPVTPPVNTRRVAAQRVREARDRLTSTSGTRPAFDTELLRQYATTRVSASFVVMLLVVSTGVDKNLTLASRNIPDVALTTSDLLNTYDVLRPSKLLFTKSAFEKVEARLNKE